jgi:CAAX prenyl protease-like protein
MPTSLRENPWLVCLLPFVVFMLAGSLEPKPPAHEAEPAAKSWFDFGIEYRHYPLVYTAKIALTVATMIFVWPGYSKYPLRLNWKLALTVGIVGAVAWIALAILQHAVLAQAESGWLKSLGARSAFNPFEELKDQSLLAYGFWALRLFGLVLVVPVIEEFFLRSCVMRYVVSERFWEVPFGDVTRVVVIAGTIVPVLMHPQEALAAAVWFSAVTWLMIRTRSIWSCVLAHATTNLLLGIYVIASGQWWLM